MARSDVVSCVLELFHHSKQEIAELLSWTQCRRRTASSTSYHICKRKTQASLTIGFLRPTKHRETKHSTRYRSSFNRIWDQNSSKLIHLIVNYNSIAFNKRNCKFGVSTSAPFFSSCTIRKRLIMTPVFRNEKNMKERAIYLDTFALSTRSKRLSFWVKLQTSYQSL